MNDASDITSTWRLFARVVSVCVVAYSVTSDAIAVHCLAAAANPYRLRDHQPIRRRRRHALHQAEHVAQRRVPHRVLRVAQRLDQNVEREGVLDRQRPPPVHHALRHAAGLRLSAPPAPTFSDSVKSISAWYTPSVTLLSDKKSAIPLHSSAVNSLIPADSRAAGLSAVQKHCRQRMARQRTSSTSLQKHLRKTVWALQSASDWKRFCLGAAVRQRVKKIKGNRPS